MSFLVSKSMPYWIILSSVVCFSCLMMFLSVDGGRLRLVFSAGDLLFIPNASPLSIFLHFRLNCWLSEQFYCLQCGEIHFSNAGHWICHKLNNPHEFRLHKLNSCWTWSCLFLLLWGKRVSFRGLEVKKWDMGLFTLPAKY